jgi:hypothetical protein
MLRLLLILALLASLGTLLVGHLKVKPRVDELTSNLAAAEKAKDDAMTAQRKADSQAKEAKKLAEDATKKSAEFKTALEQAVADLNTQRERADKTAAELETTTKIKNDTQDALAQWKATGLTPEGILKLKEEAKEANEEKAVVVGENKILQRNLTFTKAKLSRYEGTSTEVKLPPGLHGTVTAVGPANDFVFIDVGANQGVLEGGKLMVRRGDKLLTKVQIVSVAANHSVANILKDWNQGDIAVRVGDTVLY